MNTIWTVFVFGGAIVGFVNFAYLIIINDKLNAILNGIHDSRKEKKNEITYDKTRSVR